MDQERIKKCEEDYRKASYQLDELEREFAEEIIRQRAIADPYSAKDRAMSEIGPHFNGMKAKIHIAKLRLENAWKREQGE